MEDISRAWWIGYISAYVVVLSALLLAAWYLMPRPEAQETPSPVVVEAVPEQPEFRFPERPSDPAIWALFQKALDSRRGLPSFRILADSVAWEYPGATPETGYETAGRIVRKSRAEWLVKGDKFRSEHDCYFTDPSSGGQFKDMQSGPYKEWRVQNGRLFAKIYSWRNAIRARRVDPRSESDWADILQTGYVVRWADSSEESSARLIWSVETQEPDAGGLVIVRGDVSPEQGYQQLRCEFVIDPARDHLIARERYWLQGELYREMVIEARQSSGGTWFPSKATWSHGDRVWTTEYGEVAFDIPLDDSQFEIESLPCDLETVELTMLQESGGEIVQRYRNGRWAEVPRVHGATVAPNAKLEWAEPRE